MEIPIRLNLPDQEAVTPLGQSIENCMVTDLGVRLRPGYSALVDVGTAGVDGMWNWDSQDTIVIVSGGAVYKLAGANALLETGDDILLETTPGGYVLLDGYYESTTVTGGTALTAGTKPTFADFGDYLYITAGGAIQELHPAQSLVTNGGKHWSAKLNSINIEPGVHGSSATYWNDLGAGSTYTAWSATTRYGSGTADVLEDASAPTTVAFIVASDGYLLALETGTDKVHYSYPSQPWRWDGEWVSADHLPEDATCMVWSGGDVVVGGFRSIQVFQNDGTSPWSTSNYGAMNAGVLAPYSLLPVVGSYIWLDNRKRIVTLNGREAVSVNKSLDTFIQRLAIVEDAIADTVVIDGIPMYIISFKYANKTVAVNLLNNSWAEWTTYINGQADRYVGQCFTHVPQWDILLMGHKTDGSVNVLSSDVELDGTDAIRGVIRTPRLHAEGTTRAPDVAFHFTKTARTTSTATPSITARWRDDNATWLSTRTLELVDDSETDFTFHMRRCGSYRSNRQYEFNLTSMWPLTLMTVNQA